MSLNVIYNNILVGKVVKFNHQFHFKYDHSFLNTGLELSPLQMPLSKDKIYSFPNLNPNTFYGLPGLLADSIPDTFGNTILNTWLNTKGKDIKDLDSLERLSYVGNRAVGALEFLPDFKESIESEDKRVQLNKLADVSQQIMSKKNTTEIKEKNALSQLINLSTSAGGARAKALVSINDITGQIKLNHTKDDKNFYHYLIKLDSVSEITNTSTETCLTEYAYYKMARKAGIYMNTSKLIEEYGHYHFATKRFDRTNSGKKIHTQTLCAMGHYDFRDFTQNSYENLFYVARAINVDYLDREHLFRLMILNILARNQDDHTKNFGFLMTENGKWKASPAYDINFNYDPKGYLLKHHKMSINGKVDEFTREDLLGIGKQNSINKPEKIFEEVKEAVSLFPQIAQNIGVSRKLREYIFSTFRMEM